MTILELALIALIALTFLWWALVRARRRLRAQTRRDLLRSVVDPARGGVPLAHEAGDGHDPSL